MWTLFYLRPIFPFPPIDSNSFLYSKDLFRPILSGCREEQLQNQIALLLERSPTPSVLNRSRRSLSCPLYPHCDRFSTADAKGGDSSFLPIFFESIEKRNQNSSATRPDRMPKRNRSAMNVHFFGIEF